MTSEKPKFSSLIQDHFIVLAAVLMLPSVLDRFKKRPRNAVEEIMTDPWKPVMMIILALAGYIYFNHLQVLSSELASHTVAFDKVYEKFEKTQDYLAEQTSTIVKLQAAQEAMLDKIDRLDSRVERIESKR